MIFAGRDIGEAQARCGPTRPLPVRLKLRADILDARRAPRDSDGRVRFLVAVHLTCQHDYAVLGRDVDASLPCTTGSLSNAVRTRATRLGSSDDGVMLGALIEPPHEDAINATTTDANNLVIAAPCYFTFCASYSTANTFSRPASVIKADTRPVLPPRAIVTLYWMLVSDSSRNSNVSLACRSNASRSVLMAAGSFAQTLSVNVCRATGSNDSMIQRTAR
jgi:hypothetical protein